ncbi:hypothetical protein, partial [uncultured Muribaculum sp.]|uniref:hypothetical protein n=1 Tax=uncultured Muribaculum sp. TaxID=1918613 RepID=UPI00272D482D
MKKSKAVRDWRAAFVVIFTLYHWRLLKSVNAKLLNSVFMLVTRFSGLQTLSHFSNDYIGVGALKLGS